MQHNNITKYKSERIQNESNNARRSDKGRILNIIDADQEKFFIQFHQQETTSAFYEIFFHSSPCSFVFICYVLLNCTERGRRLQKCSLLELF